MKNKSVLLDPTIKHIILGVAFGGASVFVCMLLCAFVLTLKDFDASVATPMSNACLAVGAFVSGFVCTVLHKSKGLILGSVTGLIVFALITLIALFVNGGDITLNTLLRLVIMVVLSAAGGVIGVNKSAKRKMI